MLRSRHWVPPIHSKWMGKQWKQWQTLFSWAPKSLWMMTAVTKLKDTYSLEGKLWQTRQHIKKHHFANKGPDSQTYGFSSSHARTWELDHKEGWVTKNWCFWTVVLEKTLESPLHCKEIKTVNPKGNQSWVFTGRTDAEADAAVLWSPDAKSKLTRNHPDAGKDWEQEEKGVTEDKMVGWHHWLNRHEFEQTPRDSEGQGSLACCSSWGRKEADITEQLNNSADTFKAPACSILYPDNLPVCKKNNMPLEN